MYDEQEISEILSIYYVHYKNYPENKYIDYLASLNLEELPKEVLEEQLPRLDIIIKRNNNILNSRSVVRDIKKLLAGLTVAMVTSFVLSYANFSGSYTLDILNKTLKILSGVVRGLANFANGWNICEIIKDCRNYSEEKNRVSNLANRLNRKINKAISSKQELNSVNEREQSQVKAEELVKQIGEQELRDKITKIEGRILLLPKEQERDFQNRLQEALTEYRNMSRVFSGGGISLILKSKLQCLNDLNGELDKIESDLKGTLFVNEEELFNSLKINTEDFINSTRYPEFACGNIMVLMQKLGGLLECSEDLLRQIEIQNSFAVCFWASIKVLTDSDIDFLIKFLRPIFIDRVILEGESELDNLEQTVSVIGSRAMLLNMKNSENYNKREYLKELIFYVKEYGSKNKTRTREIPTN